MSIRKTATAAESGHWYTREPDGSAMQVVDLIGKNGKRRKPTLRDARTHGFVPGCTTLLRAAGVPEQLVRWRIQQAVLAALTLPRDEGESEESWLQRLELDMTATARSAAETGSDIHRSLEFYFANLRPGARFSDVDSNQVPDEHVGKCVAAWQALHDAGFGEESWAAERAVIHPLGFGTRSDLHSPTVCLDWKTKDGETMPTRLYDDHAMQLAATRAALEFTCGYLQGSLRAGIVYVSRTHDVAQWVEATPEQLQKGWKLFRYLVGYWYEKTQHSVSWRLSDRYEGE